MLINKMNNKNKIGMNKKGNGFVAWFFVVIVILAFSVFLLVLNMAWGHIETPLAERLDEKLPADSPFNASEFLGQVGGATKNMSNLLPFLIIGLFGFVLISAGALLKHPIMFG